MDQYEIRHDSEHGVVVVVHYGLWSPELGDRIIPQVRAKCRETGVDRVLHDHRKSIPTLTTLDIYERASSMGQRGLDERVRKIAVVHPVADSEKYGFFATAMRNRGIDLNVFADDYDGALAWLTAD